MNDDLTRRIEAIANAYEDIRLTTQQMVVGNLSLIEEIFISMISGGHLLIEGVPGTAKTTICKIFARLIDYDFKRVQGAVDLQPADIIGVRIYDRNKSEFILQKGPIFTNFLMVDEMNRLTPKTQSALLEAMSERQTTIDGTTYPLPDPYFAIATQNPHEAEGTFPLIESQCDRFMFSTVLAHLDAASELEILRRERAGELDWKIYRDRTRPPPPAPRMSRPWPRPSGRSGSMKRLSPTCATSCLPRGPTATSGSARVPVPRSPSSGVRWPGRP